MASRKRPIAHHTIFMLAAALATVLGGRSASAQIGDSTGLAELMFPEYFSRDVVLFVEGLNLDETQRVIVEALFQDYMDGFTDAEAAMHQSFEDMKMDLQAADRTAVVSMAIQPLRNLITAKDDLEFQLLSGVQTVLTEEQLAGWPSFLRKMRREKTMNKGRLDGESIDLFHVVRDMQLLDIAMRAIEPALDDYEVALDAALIERNNSFIRAQIGLLDSISAAESNVSTDEAERQIGLRVRIREINDYYREEIAAALPADLGAQFRQRALARAYPQIYRPTLMQRTLDDALEIPDITEEVAAAIREMKVAYESELASINAALLIEHQQAQPKEMLERIEFLRARMAGQRPSRLSERTRTPTFSQDEIAEPYMASLLSLLTPAQFDNLAQAKRFLERQQRLDRIRQAEKLDPKNSDITSIQGGRSGKDDD